MCWWKGLKVLGSQASAGEAGKGKLADVSKERDVRFVPPGMLGMGVILSL